jgi:hypothetical protein
MIWLIVSLAMIVTATGARVFQSRRVAATIAAQRKRLCDDIERLTGMTAEGDVLGKYVLRGTLHEVDVTFESHTARKLPGPSNQERPCAIVELDAALPDLVVCSVSDVDAVMGPIPSVPRAATGDTDFDAAYAIFTTPPTGDVAGGFRTSQNADALAWARPDVLRQLLLLRVFWFRAQAGHCQLVTPPKGPKSAHRVLTAAINIARSAARRSLVELPPVLPSEARVPDVWPFWGIAGIAILGGIPAGMLPVGILGLRNGWPTAVAMMMSSCTLYFGWITFTFVKWALQDRQKPSGSEA